MNRLFTRNLVGLLLGVFALAAFGAGCGPAQKAAPLGPAPSAQKTGHEPARRLPPGVTLESRPDGVTATYDLTTSASAGRIEFFAVFPAGARLSPDPVDYTLSEDGASGRPGAGGRNPAQRRDARKGVDVAPPFPGQSAIADKDAPATSPTAGLSMGDAPTTRTLGPREVTLEAGLSDAVERELRRQLTAKEEGIIRFYRVVRVVFNPGLIAGKDSRAYRYTKLTVKFPVEGEEGKETRASESASSGDAGDPASSGRTDKVESSGQAGKPAPPAPATTENEGFDRILRHLVANPEALTLYADRAQGAGNSPPPPGNRWSPQTEDPGGRWVRIPVSSSGLYRVTPEYLKRAGLEVSNADVASLRLFSRGKEVPTHLVEDSPAPSAARELVFYATGSDSPYSTDRAYWLVAPAKPRADAPPRMRARAAPGPHPAGIEPTVTTDQERTMEENRQLLISSDRFLTTKQKNWIWDELDPAAEPLSLSFDLPDIDARTTQSVAFDLSFYQTPRERLQLELNEESGLVTIYFRDENVYESRLRQAPPIELAINGSFKTSLMPFEGNSTGTVHLVVGSNHLRHQGNVLTLRFREPFAVIPDKAHPEKECSNIFFDRFSVRYRRYLYARGGQLAIRTSGGHPWHRMTGFGEVRPLVVDLTEPRSPSTIEVERLPQQVFGFYEQRAARDLLATVASSIPDAPESSPVLQTDIASAENEADYLLIYHPMFEEEIRPLLEYQGRRGMKTRAVSVDAVYQEYAAGESTPQAIKDFLLDALRHWKTPPSYVCLFGDASSDYRGELRTGIANLVPAYSWTAWDGDTWASELWYACLVGADVFPDVMLGRISVRKTDDAREVVRKTIQYGEQAPLGPWRARIGYCSDDGEMFAATTERVRTQCQSPAFGSERVYLENYSFEDNYFVTDRQMKDLNLKVSTEATLALHDAYRRGLAAMVFLGHGSPNIWTDERIWFGGDSPNSDNLNLRNDPLLPFVATFTCNHGAFDYPLSKWNICISEDMMRVKNGGSVAMYVPSGPGTTSIHEQVARSLFRALMDERLRRVGEIAAWTTIDYVLNGGGGQEMIRMFVLLGDPTVDLVMPSRVEDARIVPDRIDLDRASSGKTPVRFEAAAPDVSAKGRFSAFLYDPLGREALKSGPRSFAKGKIEWTFDLPASPQPGQWTVQGYCADPKSRRDAVFFARFAVGRPSLNLSAFEFDPKPEKAGAEGGVKVEVANDSEFADPEVVLVLSRIDSSNRKETLGEWPVSLAPGEKRTLRRTVQAIAGLQGFHVELEKGGRALAQPDAESVKDLVLYIPPETGTMDFATLPSLMNVTWRSGNPNPSFSADTRFFYSGLTTQSMVTAVLSIPDGSQSTTTTVQLRPAKEAFGETRASFSMTLAGATPRPELRLTAFPSRTGVSPVSHGQDAHATSGTGVPPVSTPSVPPLGLLPKDAGSSVTSGTHGQSSIVNRQSSIAKRLVDLPIPLGKARFCDLAIVPGSVRFTPAKPAEGETVFVDAVVENRGGAAASAFDLSLLSVEKEKGETPLESRPHCTDTRQSALAPGASRDVRLRFDYDAGAQYAGEKTIRVKADPLSRLADGDRTNNAIDAPLKILSRAETTFTLEVKLTDVDLMHKKARVTVHLENLGEAAAKGRHVGFFNKPPKQGRISEAGGLIKDIVLPPILGGEEDTYSHTWVVDLSDRETSPTALVYRPTKALRAEGEPEANASEPDW